MRIPIVPATKDTLTDSAARAGRASRAYVEQVRDIDRVADRLLAIYAAQ